MERDRTMAERAFASPSEKRTDTRLRKLGDASETAWLKKQRSIRFFEETLSLPIDFHASNHHIRWTANRGRETGVKKMANNAAGAVQKIQKAFVVYLRGDGTISNFPVADWVAVRTEFSNGIVRDLAKSDVPADVLLHAEAQGLAIRTQRSYQAEKDIDLVVGNYDETVDDLKNGVWIESKAGRPKVPRLATAIVMSLEANGQEVDDSRKRTIIEKLKESEYREKAMGNEHVQANLAQLKLDAAKKRAAEAKASAKTAAVFDPDAF